MQPFLLSLCRTLANLLAKVNFRGKGTLLSLICPRASEAIIDLHGYRVRLDLRDHIQRKMFLNSDWEHTSIFREYVKPGMTVFDIGCNVGAYTLLASRIVGPQGKVFAFEPNPKVHGRLARTVSENGITNILLFNKGIGDRESLLTLYPNPQSGNATATMVANGQNDGFTVPIDTIDNVIAAHGVDQIDYIKIDVDGFEPNVFQGATDALRGRKVRFVQAEFSDYWLKRNGSSSHALYRSIAAWGFHDIHGPVHFAEDSLTDRFFRLAPEPPPDRPSDA